MGSVLSALTSLLKYLADPYNDLPAITFWLLGSLAATARADLLPLALLVLAGLVPLWAFRWRLHLLALSDEEAVSLGVHPGRLRVLAVASATCVTAASVAATGTLGWVGLVVPHLARLVAGPAYPALLPASVLLGGSYLLVVDTLARTLGRIEIPLGTLTALVGVPVFLALLARSRRVYL